MDEIAALIVTLSKKCPDQLVDIIPASAVDNIIKKITSGELRLSRNSYDEIAEILVKFGKKIPTAADIYSDAKVVKSGTKVWSKGKYARGFEIGELLGNNLGRTYKTYDCFDMDSGVATSIKSIDTMCNSYQKSYRLSGKMKSDYRQLMNGKNTVIYNGRERKILGKELNIAIPDVPLTNAQQEAINNFIKDYGNKCKITITIVRD